VKSFVERFSSLVPDIKDATILAPQITYKDRMTLHFGGRTIELFHPGTAHTSWSSADASSVPVETDRRSPCGPSPEPVFLRARAEVGVFSECVILDKWRSNNHFPKASSLPIVLGGQ